MLVLALYFIYEKVFKPVGTQEWSDRFSSYGSDAGLYGLLFCVLLLVPVNWVLEAAKWKILVSKLERVSLRRATVGVLSGLSTSIVTPNRLGEFLGRIFYLDFSHRKQGALLSFVGSAAQLSITLLMGMLGYLALKSSLLVEFPDWAPFYSYMAWLLILLSIAALLIYFVSPWVMNGVIRIPWMRKWNPEEDRLDYPGATNMVSILGLSFSRYVVFTTQYIVLLTVFCSDVNLSLAFLAIGLVYLSVALSPSLYFSELGIREFFALSFISLASNDNQGIFIASTVLWLFNIGLPSLIGSLLLFSARIFKS